MSVAIVGPTGAGKTTIVNLLSRFYNPDSGAVLIDGIDLRKVTIESVRAQVGVMLQDSFLFTGTIRDNIRYGKLDATDEEVERAAKAVHAHEFIMQNANGYDTAGERAGHEPLDGATAAYQLRARASRGSAHTHSRRGYLVGGYGNRARHTGGTRRAHEAPHFVHHRAPSFND